MKKITLLAFGLIVVAYCYGQDSTATINSSWKRYAADTSRTYQQIVTTCDSLFALAGYPVFPDTSSSSQGSGVEQESEDGKPFFSRC